MFISHKIFTTALATYQFTCVFALNDVSCCCYNKTDKRAKKRQRGMVNEQSINLIFECIRRNLEITSIMLKYLHASMLKVQ